MTEHEQSSLAQSLAGPCALLGGGESLSAAPITERQPKTSSTEDGCVTKPSRNRRATTTQQCHGMQRRSTSMTEMSLAGAPKRLDCSEASQRYWTLLREIRADECGQVEAVTDQDSRSPVKSTSLSSLKGLPKKCRIPVTVPRTESISHYIASTNANETIDNSTANTQCHDSGDVNAGPTSTGTTKQPFNDVNKMLNVTVSTIMLLASGHTRIPVEYYMWSELFLATIKDDFGNKPRNVGQLLNHMAALRSTHKIAWEEEMGESSTDIPVDIYEKAGAAAAPITVASSSASWKSRIPIYRPIRYHSAIFSKPISTGLSRKTPSEPRLGSSSVLLSSSNAEKNQHNIIIEQKPVLTIADINSTNYLKQSNTFANQSTDAFRDYYMSMARQPGFNKIIHRLIFSSNACRYESQRNADDEDLIRGSEVD